MRVGIGYDSHRFADGRKLILGGVEVPHSQGLAGHSLTDAIMGAAGLGDIGALFPDTDARWKNADSISLLSQAYRKVTEAGLRFVSADITVIAEQPRIGPYVGEMRRKLAGALSAAAGAVSVKGKSNEGMGWIGNGEGLAVIAVAVLQ